MTEAIKKFPKKYGAQGQPKSYITVEVDKWRVDTAEKLQKLLDDFPKVPVGLAYLSQFGWYKELGQWVTKIEELLEALR